MKRKSSKTYTTDYYQEKGKGGQHVVRGKRDEPMKVSYEMQRYAMEIRHD